MTNAKLRYLDVFGKQRRAEQPPFDAVSLLTVFVWLLFVLPSPLVFHALGANGTPALVLSLAGLLLWTTARRPARRSRFELKPVRLVLSVWVIVNIASYGLAMSRVLDPEQVRSADRGLLVLAASAGVALLASDGIPTRDRLETLMSRLVIAASVCAAIAVLQFIGLDLTTHLRIPGLHATTQLGSSAVRSSFHRVAGTARHPLELSTALCMVLPIAVHLVFRAKDRNERLLRWTCLALIGTAIPMSLSWTGVLGLIVIAVVLLPTWEPARQRVAVAVAALWTIGMWLVIPGLIGTLKSLFTGYANDPSVQARTERYVKIGGTLSHHVFLGRGPGTLIGPEFIFDNQYISTTLEIGLAGLFALVFAIVVSIGLARGVRRRTADSDGRDLAQALAASAAVPLVALATFDGLAYPMVVGLVFLVLGCTGALWRISRHDSASMIHANSAPASRV